MKHNFKSFGSLRAIISLLSLALLAQATFAESQFSNEFWISTSTNTANLGTLNNPFDGSTAANFDSNMANLPPNSTIHLLAGTYHTHGCATALGGYFLKSGQKVLGSGMDATILQLVPGTVRGGDGTWVLNNTYAGTNIEVCDLTLDCNYTPPTMETYNGVVLTGTQMAVRRVKVIRQGVYGSQEEGFSIAIQPCGATCVPDSTGNIIEGCEVSQFSGGKLYIHPDGSTQWGGLSAININGGSGIIRNNRVFISPTSGNAFNNSSVHDILIEGNYVDGVCIGVYCDTGGGTNLIIAHNTFRNCMSGVFFRGTPHQNTTIAYNTIELADGDHRNGIAFNWTDPFNCTNVAIIGNTIRQIGQGTGQVYALCIDYVTGLVCANNRIDASLTSNDFIGSTGLNIYDNYDLNGNFLTNLNQVASPNGMTRRTATYSGTGTCTYNATYADKYIGIKGFSNDAQSQEVDIILPPAAGHPGKDFVVMDESGLAIGTTKRINIMSTSPDKINGGSSVGITAPYTAKTAISDGVNWFAK